MTENIALYSRLGWHETHRRTERGFQRVFFSKPAPADDQLTTPSLSGMGRRVSRVREQP